MMRLKTPVWKGGCTAAIAIAGMLYSAGDARAYVTFTLNENNGTLPAGNLAKVYFGVISSTLTVEITNLTSQFKINEIFFNSDSKLTGLSGPPGVTVLGSGVSQGQGAGMFGAFNWEIDLGTALDAGATTTLYLAMVGTTTGSTIANKLSTIPPGSTPAHVAAKFVQGPNNLSGFGAVVPEPSTMVLAVVGAFGLSMAGLRRCLRRSAIATT